MTFLCLLPKSLLFDELSILYKVLFSFARHISLRRDLTSEFISFNLILIHNRIRVCLSGVGEKEERWRERDCTDVKKGHRKLQNLLPGIYKGI